MNARETALRALYEVFYNDAYSNLALKEILLKNKDLNAADRRLVTNIVYGVVSRRYTLSYVIEKYSKIKLKKIAKYVRIILEMGIYQLVFADKIPERAAVDESVKLAKKYGKSGADRFVNGVLRAFCRDDCRIEYPNEPIKRLSVMYSFNEEMTKEFISGFGAERAEQLMASLNEAPPLMLRTNILKISPAELAEKLEKKGVAATIVKGALLSVSGFDVGSCELYKKGFYSVQDGGAYEAALSLEPKANETIIDMCAAPGGKSAHIAELTGDTGNIISFDIHEHKIKLIEETARRLGLKSITAMIGNSAETIEKLIGTADRVLCDVPCSGWGIIRRKPDIKLGRNDITTLPDLQLKILSTGAKYLKDGGTLVYSTCTINKKENSAVVNKFLEINGGFRIIDEKTYYPDTDGTDGFYICKLEKC